MKMGKVLQHFWRLYALYLLGCKLILTQWGRNVYRRGLGTVCRGEYEKPREMQ